VNEGYDMSYDYRILSDGIKFWIEQNIDYQFLWIKWKSWKELGYASGPECEWARAEYVTLFEVQKEVEMFRADDKKLHEPRVVG
jgi:hypothetical protein